jgi:hypothetical protein
LRPPGGWAWGCTFLLAWAATFVNGATQHGPAFVLRVGTAAVCLILRRRQQQSLPDGAARTLTMLALAYAWGTVHADPMGLALQPAATFGIAAAFFCSLVTCRIDICAAARDILLGIGVLHSALAVAQRLAGMFEAGSHRVAGGFFSPIDLAAFLSPLIVWSWALGRMATAHRARLGYQICSAVLLVGLWCTGARSGVLATALGLGVWTWHMRLSTGADKYWGPTPFSAEARPFIWRLLKPAALVGGLGCFAVTLRHRFAIAHDPYTFARLHIWRACLQVWLHEPWGIGLGQFFDRLRLQGVPMAGAVHYPRLADNAHSEPLQALVELGLFGAAALGVLVWALHAAVRQLQGPQRAVHAALGCTFVVPALCYTTLRLPCMALLFALWAATLVRALPRAPAHAPDAPKDRRKRPQQMLRGGLVAALVVCTAALVPQLAAHGALRWASRLRARGAGAQAVALWAGRARAAAPFSCGTATAAQTLMQASQPNTDMLAQVGAWVDLADAYPHCIEPLPRAAAMLQTLASTPQQWAQVAALWQAAAERAPHDALLWRDAARAADRSQAFETAQALLAHAVAEEPHCAGAWVGLAEKAAARGAPEATQAALAQAQAAMVMAPQHIGYSQAVLSLDSQDAMVFNRLRALTQRRPR